MSQTTANILRLGQGDTALIMLKKYCLVLFSKFTFFKMHIVQERLGVERAGGKGGQQAGAVGGGACTF